LAVDDDGNFLLCYVWYLVFRKDIPVLEMEGGEFISVDVQAGIGR
jgi:hypothetical protein